MLKQDRIQRNQRVHSWAAILVACIPLGCASPGREDYAAAALYRAEQARKHDSLIQQHEAAIQVFDREGDQRGVDISRNAAEEFRQHRRWGAISTTKELVAEPMVVAGSDWCRGAERPCD